MKFKFTRFRTASAILLSMSVGLIAQTGYASTLPVRSFKITPGEEDPAKKGKDKKSDRTFTSLNNASVKIYPDALKRAMHVIAKENEGKDVDFFVFDLQGTLVKNYRMKAKDHIRITGMARGSYIYRVFCGDEETAAGKFEIR
jgi:hypothetical protein